VAEVPDQQFARCGSYNERQQEQFLAALRGGKPGQAGEDWADFALAQRMRR
jgi:hypothetical protein